MDRQHSNYDQEITWLAPGLTDLMCQLFSLTDWLTDWLLVSDHNPCYCSDQSNTTVTSIELSSTRTDIEKEIFYKYHYWLDTKWNIFCCFSRKILWFAYQFLFPISSQLKCFTTVMSSLRWVLEHNQSLTGGFSIFMVNNVASRYLVVDQTGYHFIVGITRMSTTV